MTHSVEAREPSIPSQESSGSFHISWEGRSLPVCLMEDHREALFFWRNLNIREHTCVHIDAHLDVSDLKTPTGDPTDHPEINCGNYLTWALNEDLFRALVWVIPSHLTQGESLIRWTQDELQNWLHLELDDYLSLKAIEGRVEGSLLGMPFTVCTSDNLPSLEGPLVLDIDIDYYLDPQDGLWQSPLELAQHLQHLKAEALTVAYSTEGGYTPVRHRALGPLTILALAQPEQAESAWQSLHTQSQIEPDAHFWLKAALAARLGDFEAAAHWDSGYRESAINLASAAQMRGQFKLAKEHLEQAESPQEKTFLSALMAFKQGSYSLAAELWGELLKRDDLDLPTRLYLLTFAGRAYRAAEQPEKALQCFEAGIRLDRKDSELHYLAARSHQALGHLCEAAHLYRRAVKLAPRRLKTAEITLELVEVYLALGQRGLAGNHLRSLLKRPVPGFIQFKAEALFLRSALGKSD